MIDQEAFMAAILDEPEADGPRLVFADWLEEHGQTARAEFIRVQCELAAGFAAGKLRCTRANNMQPNPTCSCRSCILRRREAELLERHGRECAEAIFEKILVGFSVIYTDGEPFANAPSLSWEWQCGFVGTVTLTCEQLMGRECERCGGQGFIRDMACQPPYDNRPCPAKCDEGRLPPLGPAIAAVCPVRFWKISDKEPQQLNIGGRTSYEWYGHVSDPWSNVPPERQQYILPVELWKLLECAGDSIRSSDEGWKDCPAADAALAALNAAVNLWCRPLAAELRRATSSSRQTAQPIA